MASTKGLLLSAIGRLVLRHARITAVTPLGARMRRLELEGDELREVSWVPGDKVQVLLPSRDVRTYTPLHWDRARGATALAVYDHGDSPGAVWAREAAPEQRCAFVGPQRSIARGRGRAAVLFGDETSLAVAHALRKGGPDAPLVTVLEVAAAEPLRPVLTALELDDAILVERRARDAHLGDAAAHIQGALREHGRPELLFTGRAQSIQALRAQLRAGGASEKGTSKAYWSVGKTGLD